MANIKATIITIGDELLIGQTIDTNSAWIAQRLNEQGIDVQRRIAIADDAVAMRETLNEEIPRADMLLLTGGLGPTSDDVTKPMLADYFGGKMIVNEKVLEHVKQIFISRNRPMLERNLRQAEVPDCCEVLFNRAGTAPGMLFKKDKTWIISMPGVPAEMMAVMEDEVLPRLEKHFSSDSIIHSTIITAGAGESFIAENIIDIETALPPHIKLAYLPNYSIVKLRLTGKGSDKQLLQQETDRYKLLLCERLEDIIVAMNDLPLEKILGDALLQYGKTISLAESCTGGNIAHHITQVNGCSQYFKGGIVCYHKDIKTGLVDVDPATIDREGIVSEAVAKELAVHIREKMKTDIGFGITGLLDDGNYESDVPVGTVWMAVADADTVIAKPFRFYYGRYRNKELATFYAMLSIWKFLKGKL